MIDELSNIMLFQYPINKPTSKESDLRVYNKVCKLEKVAYTLFNLREV